MLAHRQGNFGSSLGFHEIAITWLTHDWSAHAFAVHYEMKESAPLIFAAYYLGDYCPPEDRERAIQAIFTAVLGYEGQFHGFQKAATLAIKALGGTEELTQKYHNSLPGSSEEARYESLMRILRIPPPRRRSLAACV